MTKSHPRDQDTDSEHPASATDRQMGATQQTTGHNPRKKSHQTGQNRAGQKGKPGGSRPQLLSPLNQEKGWAKERESNTLKKTNARSPPGKNPQYTAEEAGAETNRQPEWSQKQAWESKSPREAEEAISTPYEPGRSHPSGTAETIPRATQKAQPMVPARDPAPVKKIQKNKLEPEPVMMTATPGREPTSMVRGRDHDPKTTPRKELVPKRQRKSGPEHNATRNPAPKLQGKEGMGNIGKATYARKGVACEVQEGNDHIQTWNRIHIQDIQHTLEGGPENMRTQWTPPQNSRIAKA
ncbi:hypothetical protein NDU88_001690 [Pleurodeles waltl]|uniref:Uncharacterized protein n=1 Tax=Pleurodeles waltl TaxID=8319 RepID=A0AAV7P7F7_PLEWA|nr:hypothetical protein NDU88_001690 [Pleurodeles waltl]